MQLLEGSEAPDRPVEIRSGASAVIGALPHNGGRGHETTPDVGVLDPGCRQGGGLQVSEGSSQREPLGRFHSLHARAREFDGAVRSRGLALVHSDTIGPNC